VIISPTFVIRPRIKDVIGSDKSPNSDYGTSVWMEKPRHLLKVADDWDEYGVCIDVSAISSNRVAIEVQAESPNRLREYFSAHIRAFLAAGAEISLQNAA
jgi:hypothetical protein